MTVNLVGSFALGFLVFSGLLRGSLTPVTHLFLTTGFLGGFTTMSSFAVEWMGLALDGDRGGAVLYYFLNAVATIGASFAGRAAACAVG